MPQETNLNVAPYFDDFNPSSNFYKVLFKPAYPVQARELNNLQSILQNQIEDVGNNLFKEGSMVIPGQVYYQKNFSAIQIQPEYLGIPVSLYLDQLIGSTIRGRVSNVTAQVITYITNQQSVNGNYTIYVEYLNSSDDNSSQNFLDNEVLITEKSITYASTFIASGEGFANTISNDAARVGSSFSVNNGVYFLRGYFVDVSNQILILDQYSNTPSYRIGFNVEEILISSDVDPSLNDNAQGFNNYTAPGADRLKINAVLAKKQRDDFDDQNFVQIAEVINGELRVYQTQSNYNQLNEVLAKRTFDESGHYYVKEFVTTVRESLNNLEGNRGLYYSNQVTEQGNVPSEDKLVYKISPGKAYVRGNEIEFNAATQIDVNKPRDTVKEVNNAVNFNFGPTLRLNRVYGSPTIGFNTTNTLSLRSQRVGSDQDLAPGKEIGLSRIYDFNLESGSYDANNSNLNQWNLSLFDVTSYTDIEINVETTLTTPTHIEGENSGASAFLRYDITAGTALTAYSENGKFIKGERLKFNGELDGGRYITKITDFNITDVQSVYGIVGNGNTFTADTTFQTNSNIGIAEITAEDSGISTVSSPSNGLISFTGFCTSGNLVRYSNPGNDDVSLARVVDVSQNSMTITGITTVSGINEGSLPSSNLSVTDLEVVKTRLENQSGSGNRAGSNTLFSVMPKQYVSSIDLNGSDLVTRQKFNISIDSSGKSSTINVSDSSTEVFLPFDEERYTLIDSTGTTQTLTADKFTFSNGSKTLVINGLTAVATSATLIASVRKNNITSKTKLKNKANSIIIDKSSNPSSGTGQTTLNDGLEYGSFAFGTRVQDSFISLNSPDIINVWGVFESTDVSNPTSPSMDLNFIDGPLGTTEDIILGEVFVGNNSKAKAIYVNRNNSSNINFVYLNENKFANSEIITFQESGITARPSNITNGSTNVTNNFTYDSGQRSTIYDQGKIIRKSNAEIPTNKLIVYFESAFYESNDDGDITLANSYEGFDYISEVAEIDSYRNTDIVDARPRVSGYNVTSGSRSPLEFLGRNFDGGQHSSKNIISSGESMSLSFDHYVGRIDSVFLNSNGQFEIREGSSADQPTLPTSSSDAINIANIILPPYLFDVRDARVEFIDYKRYQMTDINKLEKRIKNLEYYTALNLLEKSTVDMFVPDINGLNRFKSGVFVDNFSTNLLQDRSIGVKNSIDTETRTLRPAHYTTAFNLLLGNSGITGIGTTTQVNADSRFASVAGSNVVRSDQMMTLAYASIPYIEQPFATRIENITPFLVVSYEGSIELEPNVDIWIDVTQTEARNIGTFEGDFLSTAAQFNALNNITVNANGERLGVSPTQWGAWNTIARSSSTSRGTSRNTFRQGRNRITVTTQTTTTNWSATDRRSGTFNTINEVIENQSLGNRIINREVINFMRSRNIEFTGTSMKPFTRVYSFFDGIDVNEFIVPKLIEIQMSSGTFLVGEDVVSVATANPGDDLLSIGPSIAFRVATGNHKYGPYDNPTDFYDSNPYSRENTIPANYSQSSTLLNVDTFSLQSEDFPEYSGYIVTGMRLIGQTSGAEATVTSVRTITDRVGTIIGSFRVPSSNNSSNQIFETGRSTFRLTSSPINSLIPGAVTTESEEIFYSQGDLDTTQEVTLSVRNARVTTNSASETRTRSGSNSSSSTSRTSVRIPRPPRRDPLAQTFYVEEETGIYITELDVFFQSKDDNLPVVCQIRETTLGTPNSRILPFSEVVLESSKVNLSEDGSVATKFKFRAPVYLNPLKEYAIVVLSNSTNYRAWISRLGEADVTSLATEEGRVIVSSQPSLGSLFKSQNSTVWTPSQYEDLKFTLYRASFTNSGNVQFFNPQLPIDLETIVRGGVSAIPKSISVGIGTTISNIGLANPLTLGNTINQNNTNGTGNLVGLAASATGNLILTNVGSGYTPSSGQLSYTGVALTSITGSGSDATADITIFDGVAIAATINNGGKGYSIGDVLGPIQIGQEKLGFDMQLSVNQTLGDNLLTIDNVQGTFDTSNYLQFIDNSGITTAVNGGIGGSVFISGTQIVNSDGLHMKIFQENHGMYSNVNSVNIKDIITNIQPTSLSSPYTKNETTSISIGSTDNFGIFENVGVSNTNPGYIKIGNEIIRYEGVAVNSLTGITRGIDNSVSSSHALNDLVYKYEFDGVSLRRINKTHNLADSTISNSIGLDSYHIKIDMSQNGVDRRESNSDFPALFFNKLESSEGSGARGTYNLPFSIIQPNIVTVLPNGTNISGNLRSISETSISGSEVSYIDQGFEPISLDDTNYFNTMRMVSSKVNEDNYLSELPGNKSLTVNLNFNTEDERISPSLDLNNSSLIFISNRANNPITNYRNDSRISTILEDPNSLIYVTKLIGLENSATSLRVMVDCYISDFNDVRLMYSLNQDVPAVESTFTAFPGYANKDNLGNVINIANNDGTADRKIAKTDVYTQVPTSSDFVEYTFSVDNLEAFNAFRIKLIGTSTNQAVVPQFRNFRVIAFA